MKSYCVAYKHGVEQKLIDQVMYQVTTLQDKIRLKIKEKEDARLKELYVSNIIIHT